MRSAREDYQNLFTEPNEEIVLA